MESSELLVDNLSTWLKEKHAEDIVVIDVRRICSWADFFVLATATSDVHMKTLIDDLEDKISVTYPEVTVTIEGLESDKWVLLDCGDVIVHIFSKTGREFYALERIWGDAPSKYIE